VNNFKREVQLLQSPLHLGYLAIIPPIKKDINFEVPLEGMK